MSYDFLRQDCLTTFTVPDMNYSSEVGLKSSHKAVGYPHKHHTTTTPVGTISMTGWCCSIDGPALGKMLMFFSSSAACRGFSSIKKLTASWSVWYWSPNVRQPKCVVSSVTRFYHGVIELWRATKINDSRLHCFVISAASLKKILGRYPVPSSDIFII